MVRQHFRALYCFSEVSVIPSLKVTRVSLHCTDTWMSIGSFPISVSGSGLYHQNNFLHFISYDPLTVFPVALIHINSQVFRVISGIFFYAQLSYS